MATGETQKFNNQENPATKSWGELRSVSYNGAKQKPSLQSRLTNITKQALNSVLKKISPPNKQSSNQQANRSRRLNTDSSIQFRPNHQPNTSNSNKKQAKIVPLSEGWVEYKPKSSHPERVELAAKINQELSDFQELLDKWESLERRIKAQGSQPIIQRDDGKKYPTSVHYRKDRARLTGYFQNGNQSFENDQKVLNFIRKEKLRVTTELVLFSDWLQLHEPAQTPKTLRQDFSKGPSPRLRHQDSSRMQAPKTESLFYQQSQATPIPKTISPRPEAIDSKAPLIQPITPSAEVTLAQPIPNPTEKSTRIPGVSAEDYASLLRQHITENNVANSDQLLLMLDHIMQTQDPAHPHAVEQSLNYFKNTYLPGLRIKGNNQDKAA